MPANPPLATPNAPAPGAIPTSRPWLERLGLAMVRHKRTIQIIQWSVVVFYMALVIAPAFQPIPPEGAHLWNNLRLFAQLLFWGIWWPGVMLTTLLFGRIWCGVFCPEGTLTEWASHRGLGRPVPRWLKWSGWPFVAFACTTLYGQLVSVYEYPQAALLVLGGSSVAAIAIGLMYGRGKRIWCRHLCPAGGVFALLSRFSFVHFKVDRATWDEAGSASKRKTITIAPVNCAPLVDIRRMTSAADCHACGRCAGHRDAVTLSARAPWQEILAPDSKASTSEALTLIFGVLGIASAAFQWTVSPWFIQTKMAIANYLVDHDHFLLLGDDAPWWLLTHYPDANDVFTWLDGLMVIGYIVGIGCLIGFLVWLGLRLAALCLRSPSLSWQRLTLALVPLAGMSVFIGLTMLTVTLLKAEGWLIPWLAQLRIGLMGLAILASAGMGVRLVMQQNDNGSSWLGRLAAAVLFLTAPAIVGGSWYVVFFVW